MASRSLSSMGALAPISSSLTGEAYTPLSRRHGIGAGGSSETLSPTSGFPWWEPEAQSGHAPQPQRRVTGSLAGCGPFCLADPVPALLCPQIHPPMSPLTAVSPQVFNFPHDVVCLFVC